MNEEKEYRSIADIIGKPSPLPDCMNLATDADFLPTDEKPLQKEGKGGTSKTSRAYKIMRFINVYVECKGHFGETMKKLGIGKTSYCYWLNQPEVRKGIRERYEEIERANSITLNMVKDLIVKELKNTTKKEFKDLTDSLMKAIELEHNLKVKFEDKTTDDKGISINFNMSKPDTTTPLQDNNV